MAYRILVKKRFTNKVNKLLTYLEKEWNKDVADKFLVKLDKRIVNLSFQPFTGAPVSSFINVRSVLITKHNRLYYRIKDSAIEIVNLYDTRIKPDKNRFKEK